MSKATNDLGAKGEALAAEHLQGLGFRILARNFRRREAEIDIIASKNGVTYFVEVKSRFRRGFANPADNITAHKRKQIAKAAMLWFMEQGKETDSTLLVAEVYPESGEILLFEDFLC